MNPFPFLLFLPHLMAQPASQFLPSPRHAHASHRLQPPNPFVSSFPSLSLPPPCFSPSALPTRHAQQQPPPSSDSFCRCWLGLLRSTVSFCAASPPALYWGPILIPFSCRGLRASREEKSACELAWIESSNVPQPTFSQSHTQTHTDTHTDTCTHRHTQTHTDTHRHTQTHTSFLASKTPC